MSVVLMSLFAVSIVGALGMTVYGLRVLVGRWDQPRRHEALRSVPKLPPLGPLQPVRRPQAAPVWVPPTGSAPAPMRVPVGVATPPPMTLPVAGMPPPPPAPPVFMPLQPVVPPPPGFMPPQRVAARPPVFMPPQRVAPPVAARSLPLPPPPPPPRAPSPGHQVAGTVSSRLARGSIPPEYTGAELDPDTDPGVILESITSPEPEPVVQRGARFSIVRSSRR